MYLRATASYSDGEGSGKSAEVVSGAPVADEEAVLELAVNPLVSGLTHPWGIAFAPDGTMLFTERGGVLSARLSDGTVQTVTADFSDLYASAETGLMGIVVDPDFVTNRRFYTCQGHTGRLVEVIAWTIDAAYTTATRVADPLVGGIPAGSRHGGCRLRFGPQGYLWIATGDAKVGTVPQDPLSRGGKVLRVDASTGAGAPDNPAAPSPVYTSGHRNVQGLALRPGTSQMWSVEHGPRVDDEINLLTAGGNYGWDPVPGYNERVPMTDLAKFPDAVEAKWSSGDPTIATSGGIFLEGSWWGAWEGRLAVASLKDESLRLFEFTATGDLSSEIVVAELDGTYDRLRTPMIGPNGALYVATANGGGRDQILIVSPNRPPAFAATTDTQSVPENADLSTIAATVAASDPNEDALTYALSGDDAASFTIPDADVGALRVAGPLDHEGVGTYQVTVTATDPSGASDSIDLFITATDVPEAPAFPASETRMRRVAEDASSGRSVGDPVAAEDDDDDPLTYTLGGTNAASFGIVESSGQLWVSDPLNYEAKSRYSVTVSVSDRLDDNGDPDDVIDDTVTVTIVVTDVNEAPEITRRDSVAQPRRARARGTGRHVSGVTDPENAAPIAWQALEGTPIGDKFDVQRLERPCSASRRSARLRGSGGRGREQRVRGDAARLRRRAHADVHCHGGSRERGRDGGARPVLGAAAGRRAAHHYADRPRRLNQERVVVLAPLDEPQQLERDQRGDVEQLRPRCGRPQPLPASHGRVQRRGGLGQALAGDLGPTDARAATDELPAGVRRHEHDALRAREVRRGRRGRRRGRRHRCQQRPADVHPGRATTWIPLHRSMTATGRIRVGEGAVLDHEDPNADSYFVTVTATDPSNASASISVEITVTDVNERPEPARDDGHDRRGHGGDHPRPRPMTPTPTQAIPTIP